MQVLNMVTVTITTKVTEAQWYNAMIQYDVLISNGHVREAALIMATVHTQFWTPVPCEKGHTWPKTN
jgi:hypothetical protein